MTEDQAATVLVVDDETDIADLYSTWLADRNEVRTAYSGAQALEKVDGSLDVVLLDRQMPDCSGDEVLEHIREREIDARVVMVTAVDPDVDIVDMPFDDYLTKPVTKEELDRTVEEMLERLGYDETLNEYFSLSAKKATLEAEKTQSELEGSEEYETLVRRYEALQSDADETVTDFEDDFESLFQEVPGGD